MTQPQFNDADTLVDSCPPAMPRMEDPHSMTQQYDDALFTKIGRNMLHEDFVDQQKTHKNIDNKIMQKEADRMGVIRPTPCMGKLSSSRSADSDVAPSS
eukprot:554828-Pyramimonas_sp.AAC.1